jgi:hypothetical protein
MCGVHVDGRGHTQQLPHADADMRSVQLCDLARATTTATRRLANTVRHMRQGERIRGFASREPLSHILRARMCNPPEGATMPLHSAFSASTVVYRFCWR